MSNFYRLLALICVFAAQSAFAADEIRYERVREEVKDAYYPMNLDMMQCFPAAGEDSLHTRIQIKAGRCQKMVTHTLEHSGGIVFGWLENVAANPATENPVYEYQYMNYERTYFTGINDFTEERLQNELKEVQAKIVELTAKVDASIEDVEYFRSQRRPGLSGLSNGLNLGAARGQLGEQSDELYKMWDKENQIKYDIGQLHAAGYEDAYQASQRCLEFIKRMQQQQQDHAADDNCGGAEAQVLDGTIFQAR